MRFTVFRGADVVGTSDLEHTDWGMGVATGRFVPGLGYAAVRAVFRGHAEAYALSDHMPDQSRLRRMWAERDALGLELRDADGADVPALSIQIYDYAAEAGEDEGYELEVYLLDSADWRRRHPDAPAI